jgi:hypothetical protein
MHTPLSQYAPHATSQETAAAASPAGDSSGDGAETTAATVADEESEWAPPGGATTATANGGGADDTSESWAPSPPEGGASADGAGFSFSAYSKGLAGAAIKTATKEKKTMVSALARIARIALGPMCVSAGLMC